MKNESIINVIQRLAEHRDLYIIGCDQYRDINAAIHTLIDLFIPINQRNQYSEMYYKA